jgi:hypothetical protein
LNRDLNIASEQKNNLATLEVSNIPCMGSVTVRWIVNGGKNYSIKVDSKKAGVVSKQK